MEAWGYLGVTNKRVIFQALGTSNAGSSVIQSELPIADVSGISSYKGTFFSFGHMALAFLISIIVAINLLFFTFAFGSGLEIAIAAMFEGSSDLSGLGLGAVGWILGIGLFHYFFVNCPEQTLAVNFCSRFFGRLLHRSRRWIVRDGWKRKD